MVRGTRRGRHASSTLRGAAKKRGCGIKYFFDENLPPRIARAFDDMGKCSTCVEDEGLRSKTDQEQLQFASAGDYVFVTADTRIKSREHERAALLEAGVQVVEFNFPRNYSMWDRFKLMVNKWEQIEVKLALTDYVVVRPNSVKSLAEDRRKR